MIVSRFKSANDIQPQRELTDWDHIAAALRQPKHATCTPETCIGAKCLGKFVDAWSPVEYYPGTTRGKRNVMGVWALVLDLDHLTESALLEALQRVEPYKYIAHATHSDRPGDRCLRIVMALSEPIAGATWPQFWSAAVAMLGLPVDTATCDASRLYFSPSRPAGSTYLYGTHDGMELPCVEILQNAERQAVVEKPLQPSLVAPKDYPQASLNLIEKVRERLRAHGPAIEGQGGDQHTFAACAIAAHDYALGEAESLLVLTDWDQHNQPPWGLELRGKLRNAGRYASGPYGGERDRFEAGAVFDAVFPKAEPATLLAAAPKQRVSMRAHLFASAIAEASKQPKILTPYAKLNDAIGGLTLHSITVLVGGPGKGKTALALELATHHAKTRPVIYYIGEMTRELLAARITGQERGVAWRSVVEGMISQEEITKTLEPYQLYLVARSADPVSDIRTAIAEAMADGCTGTPMVVVDYVQLLASVGKDMRIATMQAVRDLQVMTEDLPIVTIALSQSSRGGAARIRQGAANAEELGDTGAETAELERGATNQLVLSYTSEDGVEEHDVTIMVTKARFGGGRKLGFKFNGKTGKWTEQPDIPLSRAEKDRETEIRIQWENHKVGRCKGAEGTSCGLVWGLNRLTERDGCHRVVGNKDDVARTYKRMEVQEKVNKKDT